MDRGASASSGTHDGFASAGSRTLRRGKDCRGFSYLILWAEGASEPGRLAVARVEAESLRGGASCIQL